MDAAAVALQGGLALADLAEVDLCYAPPYSSANDPLNLAAFVGMNDLSGACLWTCMSRRGRGWEGISIGLAMYMYTHDPTHHHNTTTTPTNAQASLPS